MGTRGGKISLHKNWSFPHRVTKEQRGGFAVCMNVCMLAAYLMHDVVNALNNGYRGCTLIYRTWELLSVPVKPSRSRSTARPIAWCVFASV